MAITRQQRRAQSRGLAKAAYGKLVDIRGHLEQQVPALVEEIRERIYKQEKEKLTRDIYGAIMMYHAAYDHIYQGYGRIRTVRRAEKFADFLQDMEDEGTTVEQLLEMFKDECSLDFLELQEALNKRMEARKIARQEALAKGYKRNED